MPLNLSDDACRPPDALRLESAAPCLPAIRAQLQKLLSHRLFARSERMRRFLHFAIEYTLQGRGAELKEYLIGTEVFDRQNAYDPRTDPIVRVEARRLRSKLQAYYRSDGQNDPVRIEFTPGSYTPHIRQSDQIPQPPPSVSRSLAVVPFTNLGGATTADYFSDGLTEELIHTLTRFSGLPIVAWNSATQIRGPRQDLSSLRHHLQASHLLSGSVRLAGTRLRVCVQLIEMETGAYLWSEIFDRVLQDVFAMQEEIARTIVRTLSRQFPENSPGLILRRGHTSLTSYDYYLKARYHWHRRTPDDLTRSVHYFQAAVEADPHSARAHAGLADASTLLVDYGVVPALAGIPPAKSAALRAIELDETLSDAYSPLALIRSHHDGEWRDAGLLHRKAIALNPGCASAHHRLAIVYCAPLGRFDEGREELETAIRLDPLSSILYEGRAVFSLLQRDYDAALAGYRALLESDPACYRACTGLGRVYLQMGRFGDALTMLEKARTLAGDLPYILSALGQALALSGDHAGARLLLARLHAQASKTHVPSTCFATLHLALGETDQALAWLEKGCDQREARLAILNVHPVYDALRGLPRFETILKRGGHQRPNPGRPAI